MPDQKINIGNAFDITKQDTEKAMGDPKNLASIINQGGFRRGELIAFSTMSDMISEGKTNFMLNMVQGLVEEGKLDPSKIVWPVSGEIDAEGMIASFRESLSLTNDILRTPMYDIYGCEYVVDGYQTELSKWVSNTPFTRVRFEAANCFNDDGDASRRIFDTNLNRLFPNGWESADSRRVDFKEPKILAPISLYGWTGTYPSGGGFDYFQQKWTHKYRDVVAFPYPREYPNITVIDVHHDYLSTRANNPVQYYNWRTHKVKYLSALLGYVDRPLVSMLFH